MKAPWLRRPVTIRRLWIAFWIVLAAVVLAEPLVHRHALFGIEGIFGFHAWYGFAACVALVLLARLLGFVFKRPDTYYDR